MRAHAYQSAQQDSYEPTPYEYMTEYIHAAYWADNVTPYIDYLWPLYKGLKYGEAF